MKGGTILHNMDTWKSLSPLWEYRKLKGLKLSEVGQAMGLSLATISDYERCRVRCSTDKLTRLSMLYGVEPMRLIREYELWTALKPRKPVS
jgi:transcriptional regulator with XRE-family HTH domain